MGNAAPLRVVADEALDLAREAIKRKLDVLWLDFVAAISKTAASRPVGIKFSVKYSPGTEKIEPSVTVDANITRPTVPEVFRAYVEDSQLVLSLGVGE